MVEISLYTRNYAEGISWSLSPRCASSKQIAFNVEGRRIYKEICALAIGKSYELSCESYAGNGWLGNFLVIENKAYCKSFQEGSKETTAIKIEGKILLEKLQHTPYAIIIIDLMVPTWQTKFHILGTPREQCPLDIPHTFDYGQRCCRYEQDYNGKSLTFASVRCKDDIDVACVNEGCISNGEMFEYCYRLKLKRKYIITKGYRV